MKHFHFDHLLSGFFLADAERARRMLPRGLTLLQPHLGVAVVNVAVFDFTECEVGAYQELVISLVVVPWAGKEEVLPNAALYPVFLATSTPASRDYAYEHWYLPKHPGAIEVRFQANQGVYRAEVRQDGEQMLQLSVRPRGDAVPTKRLYQSFSSDRDALHHFPVILEGHLCEHEDQLGSLMLGLHPEIAFLRELIQEKTPVRELRMTHGCEQFGALEGHPQVWSGR